MIQLLLYKLCFELLNEVVVIELFDVLVADVVLVFLLVFLLLIVVFFSDAK